MAKRELYLPDDVPFDPSRADLDYAEAFQEVAECLATVEHGSMVQLRLSTCRNAYLTVNGMFIDIRGVLGHGSMPSPLARALEHLRRREPAEAAKYLDDTRQCRNAYKAKREVWAACARLDAEVQNYLNETLTNKLRRERLRGILFDVRSASNRPGRARESWDRSLHELSVKEPGHLRRMMDELARSFDIVEAIIRLARAISCLFQSASSQGLLFDAQSVVDPFVNLWTTVSEHGPALGIEVDTATAEPYASWRRPDGSHVIMPCTRPASETIDSLYLDLVDHMRLSVEGLYTRLSDHFRPNVGMPILPEPFVVDVSEPVIREEPHWRVIRVPVHEFKVAQPRSVRVALPHFGIPEEFYNTRKIAYADDGRRAEVAELARAAIDAACAKQANVLVLPELFLPRASVESIAQYAATRQLTLIAGAESGPMLSTGNQYVNRAIVRLPVSDRLYEQFKIYPSSLEPDSMYSDDFVHLFHSTSIGTFAVVICSDFLERNVIDALGSAPFAIDFVFVPSFNPHPELFEALAMADASRLFCHVVVANNFAEEGGRATSRGTLICSPRRPVAAMIETSFETEKLQGILTGGSDDVSPPSIHCYELSLEVLQRARSRPESGYLQIPHCRKPKG